MVRCVKCGREFEGPEEEPICGLCLLKRHIRDSWDDAVLESKYKVKKVKKDA